MVCSFVLFFYIKIVQLILKWFCFPCYDPNIRTISERSVYNCVVFSDLYGIMELNEGAILKLLWEHPKQDSGCNQLAKGLVLAIVVVGDSKKQPG